MNIIHASKLAIELMEQHGLIAKGWRFEFDNPKRRLGQCSFTHKRITLSRIYVQMNEEKLVRDTILHEIAHALVGPAHGHDIIWKLKAQSIGARPERCKDTSEVNAPETDWMKVCLDCGAKHACHRRPKFDGRRRWHVPCQYKPNRGTLEYRYKGAPYDILGKPIVLKVQGIFAKAAETVKPVEVSSITQPQINELWERLNKLEAKWKNG